MKVHKVKSGSKEGFERRRAWDLDDLKLIDGVSEQSVCIFVFINEMHARRYCYYLTYFVMLRVLILLC